jgi:hypothetical protein
VCTVFTLDALQKKICRLYRVSPYCHTVSPPPRNLLPHLTAPSPN